LPNADEWSDIARLASLPRAALDAEIPASAPEPAAVFHRTGVRFLFSIYREK
jgi:hypothetical protein